MKLASIVLTGALAFSSTAQSADIHAEIIEWVYAPCMEVAAALAVGNLDKENVDLGIKRHQIATVMLESTDADIRDISKDLNAETPWETRRAAYPLFLRFCLNTVMKEK